MKFWEHLIAGGVLQDTSSTEEEQGVNLARTAVRPVMLEHHLWSNLGPAKLSKNTKVRSTHLEFKVEGNIRLQTESLKASCLILG